MIQLNDGDNTSIFQKISLSSYGKNNNKTKQKQKIITSFLMFLIKRSHVGHDGQYCNLIYSKIFVVLDLLVSSKIQYTKNEVLH